MIQGRSQDCTNDGITEKGNETAVVERMALGTVAEAKRCQNSYTFIKFAGKLYSQIRRPFYVLPLDTSLCRSIYGTVHSPVTF